MEGLRNMDGWIKEIREDGEDDKMVDRHEGRWKD